MAPDLSSCSIKRKLRVLCLHGFRTSASIFETQLRRWDSSILDLLDPTFLDAPFPCGGKSEVDGIFSPPYYEWFQFNVIFTEYTGLEHCIEYISQFMLEHGPFDGIMGFSQGAVLSAALAGLQQKKLALSHHRPLRFVLIISGALFKPENVLQDCYSEVIKCPSVHFIGSNDWLRPKNEQVWKVFKDPIVLRHEGKHSVPRLAEQATATLKNFLCKVREKISEEESKELRFELREGSLDEIEVAA